MQVSHKLLTIRVDLHIRLCTLKKYQLAPRVCSLDELYLQTYPYY